MIDYKNILCPTRQNYLHVIVRSLNDNWAASSEKVPSNMCKMGRCILSFAGATYILGFCSPFIHFVVSNNSVSGQWRAWLDCADARSDQGHRCPHIPKDTHGEALCTKIDEKVVNYEKLLFTPAAADYQVYHALFYEIDFNINSTCEASVLTRRCW